MRELSRILVCSTAIAAATLAAPVLPAASAGPSNGSTGCAAVHIISVRGTLEPQSGSLLLTPLAQQIARETGRGTTATELEYPASMASDSSVLGVENLTAAVNTAAAECPEQRLVLLGYSQGARVVGNTLRARTALTDQAAARIAAIAVFGSPLFNGADPFDRGSFDPALSGTAALPVGALGEFTDRVRSYCAAADRVCQGGDPAIGFANALSPGHFAYFVNDYRSQAAAFVQERLGS